MALTTTATPLNCDKKGSDFTLYYNTGTCDVPVWVEHVGLQGDLNIGEVEDEEELPIRSSSDLIKKYSKGRIDITVSGETVVDMAYVGNQVLHSARGNGNPVDFVALTGAMDEVASFGWRGKFRNFDRSLSGPNTGPASGTFNLKPAVCTDCPVRACIVDVADAVIDHDRTVVGTPTWGANIADQLRAGLERALPPKDLVWVSLRSLYDVFEENVIADLVKYKLALEETLQMAKPGSLVPPEARVSRTGFACISHSATLHALNVAAA